MVEFLRKDLSNKVESLSGTELEFLMDQLLTEEERLCEVAKSSDHGKADHSDGGCDYWTYPAGNPNGWLGQHEDCWQFKAQENLSTNFLKIEIGKKYPQQALKNGGRYVFVASKKSGRQQKDRILNAFIEEHPQYAANIIVYLLEHIVDFCVSHPAIALGFLGITNFKPIEGPQGWSVMPAHDARQIQWEGDDLREKARLQIQESFDQNGFQHVHIEGKAGVGKTRFALEVCKEAKWKNRVLYGRDFSGNTEKDIRKSIELKSDMVLAIDEINEAKNLRKLKEICESYANIKLLTMGHAKIEDLEYSRSIVLDVMSEEGIARIIDRWYGHIYSSEFSRYVAHWIGGYVRLAKIFSLALHNLIIDSPSGFVGVKELLAQAPIVQLIKKMYSPADIRYLHVCSLLTVIEFENEAESEAQIVTEHLNLKWEDFQVSVRKLEDDHIVQRAGNYLYLSPNLLAVHLALDAWKTYGDSKIFALAEKLSPEAKKRFSERLSEISQSIPDFAKKKLDEILTIDDLLTEERCYFWKAFSNADPLLAVNKLTDVLLKSSPEEKKKLDGKVRRILVPTISYYADKEELFNRSMTALAELAVSENEFWANNATGEFRNKFQFFGQPREQYIKHFLLLENILQNNNDDYTKIVILALDSSIATMTNRDIPAENPGEIAWENGRLEPDESPIARDYLLFALKKINEFLPSIINRINNNNNDLDLKTPFLSLLSHVAYLFRYKTLRTAGERIFESISPLKEIMREDIRQTLFTSEEWIRKFGNPNEEETKWIEKLHNKFKDTSIKGRLREAIVDYVGYSVNEDTPEAIKKIAQEVFADNDLQTLEEEWAWLTSREAQQAGYLGAELARLDEKNLLSEHLPQFPNRGENWLLLLNYYREKNSLLDDQWLNNWMLTYAEQNPEDRRLPLAVAMYGQGSDDKAHFVMRLLSEGIEPRNFPWLVNIIGFWPKGLSYEVAKLFIEFLASKNKYRAIALEFLFYRLRHFSGEENHLPTPAKKETILDYEDIALTLVTDVKILRQEYEQRSGIIVYEWQEVSEMLIKKSPKHANKIVETIFSACLPEFVKGKSSYTDDLLSFNGRDLVAKALSTCAEKDNNSIWQSLVPYLESKNYLINVFYIANAYKFHGIFNHYLNSDKVVDWINNDLARKNERIELIAELVKNNFNYDSGLQNNALNESCLIARMLEAYPDSEYLFRIFFTNLTCGVHSGATSSKIQKVIDELRKIKQTTKNVAVNAFIDKSLPNLEDRKKREEEREKEEKLLYGF